MAVQEVTNSSNQEFLFFLYGKDLGNNKIEFSKFMSESGNRQNTQASFIPTMINNSNKS